MYFLCSCFGAAGKVNKALTIFCLGQQEKAKQCSSRTFTLLGSTMTVVNLASLWWHMPKTKQERRCQLLCYTKFLKVVRAKLRLVARARERESERTKQSNFVWETVTQATLAPKLRCPLCLRNFTIGHPLLAVQYSNSTVQYVVV